jgi:hypothetical protein
MSVALIIWTLQHIHLSPRKIDARLFGVLGLAPALALLLLTWQVALARDLDGRYAAANPELKAWFDSLRSRRDRVARTPTARPSATSIGNHSTGIIVSGSMADGSTCPTRLSSQSQIASAEPWWGLSAATSESPSAASCRGA